MAVCSNSQELLVRATQKVSGCLRISKVNLLAVSAIVLSQFNLVS